MEIDKSPSGAWKRYLEQDGGTTLKVEDYPSPPKSTAGQILEQVMKLPTSEIVDLMCGICEFLNQRRQHDLPSTGGSTN